jgi:hypothetical protein
MAASAPFAIRLSVPRQRSPLFYGDVSVRHILRIYRILRFGYGEGEESVSRYLPCSATASVAVFASFVPISANSPQTTDRPEILTHTPTTST